MKKQIAIASAILAATSFSFAEIALTESLSVEGFVYMSWNDRDSGESQVGIDQVEFDFLFNFGKVTGQVDVEFEDGRTAIESAGNELEQAFATYDLGNGSALTFGRFASQLGFEAFEPTGLYQYSTAYNFAEVLPSYDQGVKYTSGSFGIALVDVNNDYQVADGSNYAIEVAYSTNLGEGLNGFLGARYTINDNADDSFLVNAYVTYETGAWIYALELVSNDDGTDQDSSGLVMANYSYSDVASITVRLSFEDDADATFYTLAHNYALTDNLALVAEVSQGKVGGAESENAGAVELLFTF